MVGLEPTISCRRFSGLREVYHWADLRSDPSAPPENGGVSHIWMMWRIVRPSCRASKPSLMPSSPLELVQSLSTGSLPRR